MDEKLAFRIMQKRQQLKDQLNYAYAFSPIFLPLISNLKKEIAICDIAINRIYKKAYKTATR